VGQYLGIIVIFFNGSQLNFYEFTTDMRLYKQSTTLVDVLQSDTTDENYRYGDCFTCGIGNIQSIGRSAFEAWYLKVCSVRVALTWKPYYMNIIVLVW
jgi:hypothetical protein